jgi:pyrrolidone-carboxylate peptidase
MGSSVQSRIDAALKAAPNHKLSREDVDAIFVGAQGTGGTDNITPQDRQAIDNLLKQDVFSDESARNELEAFAASRAQPGFVSVSSTGTAGAVQGRYEQLNGVVPGMIAKVGVFDGVYSLSGTATGPGTLTLTVNEKPVSVQVAPGDTPQKVLQAFEAKLPQGVGGVVLAGDVQPFDLEAFRSSQAVPGDAAHIALYNTAALQLKPGERPLRVVVTGYGDFMGVTTNPSDTMARQLAENQNDPKQRIPGADVSYVRLDVTTDAVDAFIAQMKANPPDVILSMGQGGDDSQLEGAPNNELAAGTDGDGHAMTARTIVPGGPEVETPDLDIPVIDAALMKGYGKKDVVETPGLDAKTYQPDRSEYLCNYLGYLLAYNFNKTNTAAGFVHVLGTTPVRQMETVLTAIVAHQRQVLRDSGTP